MKPKNQLINQKPLQNLYIKKNNISDINNHYNIINNKNNISINKSNDILEKNKMNIKKVNKLHQNKNDFISISDLSLNNEQVLDNNNYMNIIQTSIKGKLNNNYEKIKIVDANNYLNKENDSITSFNELKLSIFNKNHNFNTPFIFCKNGIDFSDTEKIEEEKNYQIKRYRYLKNYKYIYNPSIQKKNSRIIQKWWKIKINPKIKRKKNAIKIQSIYRGYITRKHLNDIICISVIFQNFINKLSKVFTHFVRRNYFPKRFYKKKYALEKIFPLKLKLFFRKWKNYKMNCEQKEDAAKNMTKIREKNRYILLILKSYFNIWKSKCKEINQNEKNIKLLNDKDKKYIALNKLFNKIENIANKQAFTLSKNNLRKYLMFIFRNKYAKKILKFYEKLNLKRRMKKYFDKWRNNIIKEKGKNLKIKILSNEIKNQIRLNDKENLRNNFNNLRSKTNLQNIKDLKRAKEKFLFPQGSKHIINCIRKNIIRLVFKKYIRKINIRKKLTKIIDNSIKKYYLKKWNKIIEKEKYNEKRRDKIKKLMLTLSRFFDNKRLTKYLFKWKSHTFINKFGKEQINNNNKFCNSLLKYINIKNKPNKKYIFEAIKNHINPKGETIQKKLRQIINKLNSNNKLLILKNVIEKWKKFTQYRKLQDLRAKNLETVARLSKAVYDTKKLSKHLYGWKEKNNLLKFINNNKLNNNINNMIDCLMKIKHHRMKLFFNSLKKAKSNLLLKIIVKNISNNFFKKTLGNKFNNWKLHTIKEKNKYQLANIDKLNKLKIIVNNVLKKLDKSRYGSLKKTLNKWYLISKLINIDNYNQFLKNIKTALGKIKNICVKHLLKEALNKIKFAEVNKKNVILQRLKKYFIKNDKIILRKAFMKLFANAKNESKNILKANILFNLKQKFSQFKSKMYLTKYFNKWKLLNNFLTKEKIIAAKRITNSLNEFLKKHLNKYSFDKLKYIKRKYYLNEFIIKLLDLYTLSEKRCLYNNLRKWKNISDKMSFNNSQRQKGYEIIYNTLSKAFSFKKATEILSSMINKHKEKNYKFFFDRYKKFFQNKVNYNYKNSIKNSKIPKKCHFVFKKYIKPILPANDNINENNIKKEKNNIILNKPERKSKFKISNKMQLNKKEEKNIVISLESKKSDFYIERLIPYLISYLNKRRLRRLEIAFESIYYTYKNNLFNKKLLSWKDSQNILMKKNLLNSFKKFIFKQKILDYMRKKGINKLTSVYLVITKRRNDLFILVHLTTVFKRINQLKKSLKFLRLWRLYLKLVKEKRAQLQKMERSFSQTYEALSDSIFVDKGDERSVQTQMMNFVDEVNYWDKRRKKSVAIKSMDSLVNFSPDINSFDNLNKDNNNIHFHQNYDENISEVNNINNEKENDISDDEENNIKSSLFN